MAAKKKSKAKTKSKAKKAKATKPKAKKAARTAARKPKPAKKVVKAKKSAPAKAKSTKPAKPATAVVGAATATPPPGERIGVVTHYYSHLSVAIIKLETGALREGDTVHIKGHTSDFAQRVESMEVDHVHVSEARPGQSFGLRVKEHAREHDVVYKVTK